MPRVRRSTAKVQEADAQKMDEVAVNVSQELVDENNDGNVTILEQLIVAEKSKHATEMALRKELIELKKQHQMELRELQESLDSITEEKPKVSRRITKDQAAARKTISLALPKFCGEPDVWPFFISSFKTTTEECGLNNIENMKRLMDSLGGEALEAVKGRLIFPDAVPGVIKELESRFGRPRKLLENLLRKVRETPSPTDNHLESFITFGFKVKQLCDHLVASNMTDHQNNPFLVEELIDKLPPRCKVEWVRFKRDKEGSVMAIFGEYIQTVIDEVSEVTDCTPVSSQKAGKYEALKQRSRPVKSNAVQMRNNVHDLENSGVNQLKMTCWVCSNTGHSLKECDQFKEMTLVDRFKTLEKLKIYVPVLDHPNEAPSMIIGLDNIDLFAALETRIGNRGEPIAVRSKLGWTVYGVDGYRKVYNVPVNMHQIQSLDNRQLHDMMKQQYQLEELRSDNYNPPIANEEQRARDILEKTTCRVGDRFQTGLLWRDDVRELPESYPMAEKRMLQLSRKLSKKPDLNTAVCRMIQEYQDKGYAHELAESELVEGAYEPVWYLPLNVVQHAKKPDKIRLVWDAAASVDGVSLNSLLLKGPDMLVPLPKIICKFREKPIAFGGDIKEMFHQLRICEKDKHAQRFLFGTKPCGAPRVYVMDVATFGATCSPCSAQYVKNLNAREFAEQFPGAASAIIGNHYVDDYYDSADSVGEAVELAKDVRYVHSRGGFHIRNWVSNSMEFLEALEERNATSTLRFTDDKESTFDRVLGICWKPQEDVFCFEATTEMELSKYVTGTIRPSKRVVLSVVMAQFDPMGFITPVTIRGKMLIQDLWRSGCDWDTAIDAESHGKWVLWIKSLMSLKSLQIPRCYFGDSRSQDVSDIQLHVFTDASETAFGCVAYLRAIVHGKVWYVGDESVEGCTP
ncbi:uncharacterized protein LOC118513377 isoform X1 [Anopheles stephensi]|uniref:uncharacterized protein LOC118513377 isoform X1 n=1 Tax=Anopheles stephensi TaxID=30069 RepID=UPI00165895D3|nr:uncharacterized protein LOC118513377 isoform X1 [Anopheles stephensi]